MYDVCLVIPHPLGIPLCPALPAKLPFPLTILCRTILSFSGTLFFTPRGFLPLPFSLGGLPVLIQVISIPLFFHGHPGSLSVLPHLSKISFSFLYTPPLSPTFKKKPPPSLGYDVPVSPGQVFCPDSRLFMTCLPLSPNQSHTLFFFPPLSFFAPILFWWVCWFSVYHTVSNHLPPTPWKNKSGHVSHLLIVFFPHHLLLAP